MIVHKANHGPGAPPDLYKTALDDVGGAQLPPEMPGKAEKRQQLRQIAFQLPNHAAVLGLPATAEAAKGSLGLTPALGALDRLGVGFDRLVIAFADPFQNIAHLVYPAALMQNPRIDGLNRRRQPRAAIGDDQQQLLAGKATTIQILQQPFPGSLAFPLAAQETEQLAGAILPDSIGHQHLHPPAATGPP